MITGRVIGGEAVVAKFEKIPEAVRASLPQVLERLAIKLQRNVVAKLTDDVLRVRTGTLRRSIGYAMSQSGSRVAAAVGTNVKYARIHEYGFDGTETVREHVRRITQAFGKPLASPVMVNVSAHTRHVHLPARSFLRSALNEMEGDIVAKINEAVMRETRP